jgi:glycosyltransferase involved in cell wall biosynthesis
MRKLQTELCNSLPVTTKGSHFTTNMQCKRKCIINLGLYRTGSTTLANALSSLGLSINRHFPDNLSAERLRGFLLDPSAEVHDWWFNDNGKQYVLSNLEAYELLGDGWMPLLVFLPPAELESLTWECARRNYSLQFFVTTRCLQSLIESELHHWVIHDLEQRAGLSFQDRERLSDLLSDRARKHDDKVKILLRYCQSRPHIQVTEFPLRNIESWPLLLEPFLDIVDREKVLAAFHKAHSNPNPLLPVQGVLLTLRISDRTAREGVKALLSQLERDPLCEYIVVLALDQDEIASPTADAFCRELASRPRMRGLHILENQPTGAGPFPICRVWHNMAEKAWDEGASWVVLLGDDVTVDCPFHYRAIYRCFLDQQEKFGCSWFGCPWFNDETFPGFPTFPVIGCAHNEIFGGLIPKHRVDSFWNQDLDPYLQRLYLKFGASPPMIDMCLRNHRGGSDSCPARYERCGAIGWRDWVLDDVAPIAEYLGPNAPTVQLVDVVIPTFRLDLEYLKGLCSLSVPREMRTTFIVIVDNPQLLLKMFRPNVATTKIESKLAESSQLLERWLVGQDAGAQTNNIRVRCNSVNQGASASRNRGIDESSAEYILFLDDDVRPKRNLLEAYSQHLSAVQNDPSVYGLVGLVRFPRSPNLPLKHCAALMSYLTFMFEIALNPAYKEPAWGVTANLLVKRTKQRFDIDYAKSGGGEDVDFCLRLLGEKTSDTPRLLASPNAVVHHEFWPGSPRDLGRHFFLWATGDSALFARFPDHCYRSWPNLVETLLLASPLLIFSFGLSISMFFHFIGLLLCLVAADTIVDMANAEQFRHRRKVLEYERSILFCIAAHLLANIFVVILETGRLYGHARRLEIVSNFAKRFDWHCGRLAQSRTNFRRTEWHKFVLFAAVTAGFYLKMSGLGGARA